ncbi:enoyl-CoA hydratase-related protein [Bradyrhizobium sp. LHD-71]|uniref:enoyl-CoA hydratase/isomerase family protein n=1 Tax=Bradyrhizobium sp. LHD-71 TaxID=3072141 RepID=UPI002810844F|nr:enoyl-CoA hydratase-related protein [Bradyrhizobium sp. LHD-71]MDQ8731980.1 enoyl-CoA hydratase-related protein [Bradyrhizobium sp. LHD-71]
MPVLFETRGHAAILTLSRPEARNAWGDDFNEGLKTLLQQAEHDHGIRCVILTGDEKGGAFSAGANLANAATHTVSSPADFITGEIPAKRNFVANLLTDFAKPVIAAVNGYAVGIGCIATYSCDLIVASERAEWRLPQVRLGILPAYGGAPRLARWVGKGNAMRAALGYSIDATEAYRIGLAQWLVPHEQLMEQALKIADDIAAMPPLAARLVKESLTKGLDIPNIRDASEADTYRFMVLSMTEDAKESHRAWREKRKPSIQGK